MHQAVAQCGLHVTEDIGHATILRVGKCTKHLMPVIHACTLGNYRTNMRHVVPHGHQLVRCT